jgi:hypothetical protein
MCASCGCNVPNDTHNDSRNITLQDLDQAAQAAGTTRDSVIQNIVQCTQSASDQPVASAQTGRGDYYQSSLEQQPGRQPGEVSPELGQDAGTAWQEGMQMGNTEQGGVDNPPVNP